MNKNNRKEKKKDNLNILKFIGFGLLVTVGFIDPGNWASNIAAGSGYGYTPALDGNSFNDYADYFTAQCGTSGDCDGIVSVRGQQAVT